MTWPGPAARPSERAPAALCLSPRPRVPASAPHGPAGPPRRCGCRPGPPRFRLGLGPGLCLGLQAHAHHPRSRSPCSAWRPLERSPSPGPSPGQRARGPLGLRRRRGPLRDSVHPAGPPSLSSHPARSSASAPPSEASAPHHPVAAAPRSGLGLPSPVCPPRRAPPARTAALRTL